MPDIETTRIANGMAVRFRDEAGETLVGSVERYDHLADGTGKWGYWIRRGGDLWSREDHEVEPVHTDDQD